MQCDCNINPSTNIFQSPQEQPGVMSLRTQSTDIFTQLCSLPSMTMSQDVSKVLHWGREGCIICVWVCVKGFKLRPSACCCEGHEVNFPESVFPNSHSPTSSPSQTVSTSKIRAKTKC